MATSPLFGWEEPDDTDLVKDGAAAIRTLGNAIDTSMGDLLGGSSGQVLAKASGTNMDFTWTTPTAVPSFVAGKNAVINGGFDIWQRGTSFASNTLNGYCADRWKYVRAANTAGITISQVASPQTGLQYGIKQQRTASNTSTDATYLAYGIETKDFLRFAGQTVTLSFYGVKGANFSGVLSLYFAVGTGTDENPLGVLTGENVLYNDAVSLTTNVARYSVTFAVPSTATDDRFYFSWAPTGTAGADDSFTITGVQLEVGSTATPFSRNASSIQGELAACQRYYQRITAANNYGFMGDAIGYNSTTAYGIFYPKVTMRDVLSLDYSTICLIQAGSAIAITSATIQTTYVSNGLIGLALTTASGVTADRPYQIAGNNNGAAYLGISGEL